MSQATKPISNHIAIVFDFDRTLIPDDSFYLLLEDFAIDVIKEFGFQSLLVCFKISQNPIASFWNNEF